MTNSHEWYYVIWIIQREFILCDLNRDADSYRSPWSNKYHPPLKEGLHPSLELRKLEIEANEVFTLYRDQ
nr:probable F-actin-capping protein subunit beta [Tanacetum cinerariifolium]